MKFQKDDGIPRYDTVDSVAVPVRSPAGRKAGKPIKHHISLTLYASDGLDRVTIFGTRADQGNFSMSRVKLVRL